MTVKDLKKELENYNEDAEVIVVNWEIGDTREPTIGSDDADEYEKYCRISTF